MGCMGNTTFFPATLASSQQAVVTPGDENVKDLICCADDLVKVYTHVWTGFIRRVKEIRFSSEAANLELALNVEIVRTFYYDPTYPYDLTRVEDVVVSV